MKTILSKHLLFLFLSLFITLSTAIAYYSSPQFFIKKHQNSIFASPGYNIDFKFEVISSKRWPITHKRATYINSYGANKIDDPYELQDQVSGLTYYYIKLMNVQMQSDGRYQIQLTNNSGNTEFAESLLIMVR